MTALAHSHGSAVFAALHSALSRFVADTKDAHAAMSRVIEFSRRCEAEFSSTGRVSPETLAALSKQL